MKFYILITALFLSKINTYCQTKEETINWINSYGSGLLLDSKITISSDGEVEINHYSSSNKNILLSIDFFNLKDIYLPTKKDNVFFKSADLSRTYMSITCSQEKIRNHTPENKDFAASDDYTKYTDITFKEDEGAGRFSNAFIHLANIFGCNPKPKKDLF